MDIEINLYLGYLSCKKILKFGVKIGSLVLILTFFLFPIDASPDGNNNSPNKRSAAMDVLFVSVLPVPPSRYDVERS